MYKMYNIITEIRAPRKIPIKNVNQFFEYFIMRLFYKCLDSVL